jgi:Flp pilus assembly protein TadD
LSARQIEAELHGQLNLFPEEEGRLILLPIRLSPFEEAVQLHERDDPRAEAAYLRAIEAGDSVCDAYCNLGILEFERDATAAAFDRFTQALALDPRHFEAKFNLASLYFEGGELRLARMHFEQAARLEPDCFDCRFNLAVALAMDGKLQEAAEVLHEARSIASEDDLFRLENLLSTLETSPQS